MENTSMTLTPNQRTLSFLSYAVSRLVLAEYKEATNNNHTFQSIFVLDTLMDGKAITMNALSEAMLLDSSAVSTLVSRMEKKGWVHRDHGTVDRRTVFVKITDEGKAEQDKYAEPLAGIQDSLEGLSTHAELMALQRVVIELHRKQNPNSKS